MATDDFTKISDNVAELVRIAKASVGQSGAVAEEKKQEAKFGMEWYKGLGKINQQEAANAQKEAENISKFNMMIAGAHKVIDTGYKYSKQAFMFVGKVIKDNMGKVWKGAKDVFSQVKSMFLGLFGEESEWFGLIGSVKDKIVGIFQWTISGLTKIFKTPKWANKIIDTIEGIGNWLKKKDKRDMIGRGQDKKGGGFGIGWIGLAMTAIGVYLGYRIRAALAGWNPLPFLNKIFGYIKLFFGKIAKVVAPLFEEGKFLGKIFAADGALMKIFGVIKKIFQPLINIVGKLIGPGKALIRGLRLGLGKLFWPIQIIVSLFDFIEGFSKTEGTIVDKLIGGLKNVFMKFIELPVKIVGWLVEKIAGWFGIEMEGTADKIMGFFSLFFDAFYQPFRMVLKLMEPLASMIMDGISPLINGIVDWISGLWDSVKKWLADKLPSWAVPDSWAMGGGAAETPKEQQGELLREIPKEEKGTLINAIGVSKFQELANMKNTTEEQKKAIIDALEEIKKGNKEGAKTIISQIAAGGGGGQQEVKQIPDETNLPGVFLHNEGMY